MLLFEVILQLDSLVTGKGEFEISHPLCITMDEASCFASRCIASSFLTSKTVGSVHKTSSSQ
jgi:hypothetical protein